MSAPHDVNRRGSHESERELSLERSTRLLHEEYPAHDRVETAEIGIGSRRQAGQLITPVRRQHPRIEHAHAAAFTAFVCNRVMSPGRIFPANCGMGRDGGRLGHKIRRAAVDRNAEECGDRRERDAQPDLSDGQEKSNGKTSSLQVCLDSHDPRFTASNGRYLFRQIRDSSRSVTVPTAH
jgi:hypothetical protein